MRLRNALVSGALCARRRILQAVLILGLLAGCAAAPARAAGSPPAREQDYTDKLALKPGLVVRFPITNGIDTHWQPIGDYVFTASVDQADENGFSFKWSMTDPTLAAGLRAVSAPDVRSSYKVSLFYPSHESATMVGYTNAVRVSDALYQDLKLGRTVRFELDGPDIPLGRAREPGIVPSTLRMAGVEPVPVIVNGERAFVRAIKADTDNGWTYWIMDNPRFPIIVQGNGPFGWREPSFDLSLAEAREIIQQLEEKGEATTYAIHFAFDSAALQNPSGDILRRLAKYLQDNPQIKLTVEGHTDIIGGMDYNLKLSQRRALSVKSFLVSECGIAPSRLEPVGLGYLHPVASNATARGRARNRRVVFKKVS